MSSSSSASSSSSQSSPSTPDDTGNGGADPGPSTRRTRDFEGPSSSRQRAMNEVWPEPFLEALATQVAIEAARSDGRLASAPALAHVFRVCSTWRAVSRSDPLWQRLTSLIWHRGQQLRATWNDEFMYWYRTARNFVAGRYAYTSPHFNPSPLNCDPHTLYCRCLALSDFHLACGFADGTVRLFDLETSVHVSTFRAHHGDLLGPFSRSVSGIVITNSTLVFATLDGNIYVADIHGPQEARRARSGDVFNNGVLVEFAGCSRWWVGLFAGIPLRSFRVWDAYTELPVFIGGSLTDPESVMGWHMLTELIEPVAVGRLRVTTGELAVACTSSRLIVFDLRNPGIILRELESSVGFIVTSLDVSPEAFVIVDRRGRARVRRASTLEPLSEFLVSGASLRGLIGCMNLGYTLIYAGGVIRVWDTERRVGRHCLTFAERVGRANAMVANERHVAMSCDDTSLHLWDFGLQ